MPRYTSETTAAELKALVKKSQKGNPDALSPDKLNAAVLKDLKKVNFSLEAGPVKLTGLEDLLGVQKLVIPHFLNDNPKFAGGKGTMAFMGALAGAKNEVPVFFILYQDYTGELRGYVPKKGNSWDTKTKAAKKAGADGKSLSDHFDAKAIKADIASRIQFFGKADASLSFIPDAKLK